MYNIWSIINGCVTYVMFINRKKQQKQKNTVYNEDDYLSSLKIPNDP